MQTRAPGTGGARFCLSLMLCESDRPSHCERGWGSSACEDAGQNRAASTSRRWLPGEPRVPKFAELLSPGGQGSGSDRRIGALRAGKRATGLESDHGEGEWAESPAPVEQARVGDARDFEKVQRGNRRRGRPNSASHRSNDHAWRRDFAGKARVDAQVVALGQGGGFVPSARVTGGGNRSQEDRGLEQLLRPIPRAPGEFPSRDLQANRTRHLRRIFPLQRFHQVE